MTLGLELLEVAIRAALAWFTDLFHKSGYLDVYVGIVLITISFHRLFAPVFTRVGSDRASRRFKSSFQEDT